MPRLRLEASVTPALAATATTFADEHQPVRVVRRGTGHTELVSGRHNRAMEPDLAHQPAVAMFLLFIVVGGLVTTIVNLRNADLWLLQIIGRRADGVVEAMELVTGQDYQPMSRPIVAFTTDQGERTVGRPALYRQSPSLAKGMTVAVRYATGNPARIVVPGFGFRYREPVYACLGMLVAISISALYFQI